MANELLYAVRRARGNRWQVPEELEHFADGERFCEMRNLFEGPNGDVRSIVLAGYTDGFKVLNRGRKH